MGPARQLRDNIKTLLDAVHDGSGNDIFEEISKEPKFSFKGYPACFIAPSGNENDYLTTQDNIRVYAYKVWCFQEFEVTKIADAYNILLDAVDNVINKIDREESPDLGSRTIDDGLTSPYTLANVEAVPGRFASDEVEKLLAVEITIRCKITVDLTQL